MRVGSPALCVALLTLASAAAAQQGPTTTEPGGIATIVATFAAPAGADSGRYILATAPGVRAFAPERGPARVSDDGNVRLPFTFGIPGSAPAGSFPLARVRLEWPGGAIDSVDLAATVAPRRAVAFHLGAEEVTVAPGGELEVGYRLRNRGNAADTFRITVDGPAGWGLRVSPATVVVAAGDTAAGTVRLRLPPTAARGAEHVVKVALTGPEIREFRRLRALVVAEEAWLEDVAHVPGSVFVGSSSDGGGLPGLALEAAGMVRPGTRVSLMLRHAGTPSLAPAFRGELGGPRLRLAIDAPAWALRLGDVFMPAGLLGGPVSEGRGFEVRGTREGFTAEALVAAPASYGSLPEAGHMARGAASVATDYGRFGVQAASTHRVSPLFGDRSRAGATATWSYQRPGHELFAEAGLLTVQEDGAATTGFAGEARYLLSFERGSATARFRRVPGTTPSSAAQGNEAFLSGSVRVTSAMTATGWAFLSSSPLADEGPYGRSRGAAGGARFRLPVGIHAELIASYRQTETVGDTIAPRGTRTVRGSMDVPLGNLTLETDVELGTIGGATTGPYRQLRSGLRWMAGRQWAWVGASYYDLGAGPPQASFNLSGATALRGVEVQGGLTVRMTAGPAASLWSAATVPLTRDLRLTLGIDHRPGVLDPWRFSLGASRALSVPLPLRRQPALHGVVFEDLNGNRLRDPDEPLVSGVPLLLGPLRAESDDEGGFRFYDAARGALRVDPGGVPAGMVVPAEAHLPTSGYVEVPVIRTATLTLDLFLDRDRDGARSGLEGPADAAVVSLRDATGLTRDAVTDAAGRVRFGHLAPGPYTVTIQPPRSGRAAAPPLEIQLTIEPGADLRTVIAVPLRTMEIRMPDGTRLDPAGGAEPAEPRA